ncbi:hypothetical protein FBU30_010408 [Linnemannia zychae]|nr:hypothetical protein FBU30_010408 [Linnemannia zychae]
MAPNMNNENGEDYNGKTKDKTIAPLYALVKRLLPEPYHGLFVFVLSPDLSTNSKTNVHDPFRLYNIVDKDKRMIAIEGATLSALGVGLNHYLKHICKVELTWSGDRFDQLPEVPPLIPAEAGVDGIVRASFVPWRYYMNVVTFGYSFAFWDWKRWQLELDWMMLNGINMALAMVGQEYVVRRFYNDQGLKKEDIDDFLGAPAFMPWQRMGNIQGNWVPQEKDSFNDDWIDSQWALQGQIMRRIQEFNITPVMPSFQGFVPRKLPDKYPNDTFVFASDWGNLGKYSQVTAILPTEPLFITLSQQFTHLQKAMYKEIGIDLDKGHKDNFYLLDLFNEMMPPCVDTQCLQSISSGVMRAMKAADPKAVWAMQGWFLIHLYPWGPTEKKAFFDGIKQVNEGKDAFVFDLYSDVVPVWDITDGFYGTSWSWSMLNNFGGGQGLYGTLPTLLTKPFEGYHQPAQSMRGIGITMEGINNNEYLYQLILDIPWQSVEAIHPTLYPTLVPKSGSYPLNQQGLDGQVHLEEYIKRRYGPNHTTPAMLEAWTVLSQTVWDCRTKQDSQSKTYLDNTPMLNMLREGFMRTSMWYNQSKVVDAWKQLVESTETELSKKRRHRRSVIQDSIEAVLLTTNGHGSTTESSTRPNWRLFLGWIQQVVKDATRRFYPHSNQETVGQKRAAPDSILPSESELPLKVSSFQYDLVDVTREVLAAVVLPGLHRELVEAYTTKDLERTKMLGQLIIDLIQDIDRILSTHSHFMIGPWIRDARLSAKVAPTSHPPTKSNPISMNQYRDYLEYNARIQVTWWGFEGQKNLANYASKHWGGLVKEFQSPRWKIFVNHLVIAIETGTSLNETDYLAESLKMETEWIKETSCLGGCFEGKDFSLTMDKAADKKYPLEAVEDTALVAQDIVDRWGQIAARLAREAKLVNNAP